MELSTGNTIDLILRYSIENQKLGYVSLIHLQKNLLQELNEDEILLLFKRIDNSHDRIAEIVLTDHQSLIRANGLTARFLKQGGFSVLESKELEEIERGKRQQRIEYELAESNIRSNEMNEKVAKRNKRETIINIILGVLNIFLLLWQILK